MDDTALLWSETSKNAAFKDKSREVETQNDEGIPITYFFVGDPSRETETSTSTRDVPAMHFVVKTLLFSEEGSCYDALAGINISWFRILEPVVAPTQRHLPSLTRASVPSLASLYRVPAPSLEKLAPPPNVPDKNESSRPSGCRDFLPRLPETKRLYFSMRSGDGGTLSTLSRSRKLW